MATRKNPENQPSQEVFQKMVNDTRYTISLEYCGTVTPCYVVRFYGKVVCIETTETRVTDFIRIRQTLKQPRLE